MFVEAEQRGKLGPKVDLSIAGKVQAQKSIHFRVRYVARHVPRLSVVRVAKDGCFIVSEREAIAYFVDGWFVM